MAGSFPPSSSTTGVRFFAAAVITFRPVATLPVNTTFATRGSSTRAGARPSSTATTFTTPSGRPALRHRAPEAQAHEGGGRRGLQHHGVAGGQGGGHAHERDREGIVPGGDDEDHSEGCVDEAAALVGEEEHLALDRLVPQDVFGVEGQVLQGLEGREDLDGLGLGHRLALLAGDQRGQILGALQNGLSEGEEVASPLAEGQAAPTGKRGACREERPFGLGPVQEARLCEHATGGGVQGRPRTALARHFPSANPGMVGLGRQGHGIHDRRRHQGNLSPNPSTTPVCRSPRVRRHIR